MPKLTCLCGEVINLSPDPNPHGFSIIPDGVRESALDSLVAAFAETDSKKDFELRASTILSHILTPGIMQMYECPKCGRLAVFGRASDSRVALWFQLELADDPGDAHSLNSLANTVIGQRKAEQAKS